MKISCLRSAAAGALLLVAGSPTLAAHYDLVIRNGRVLDGAGNPWVRADVAVRRGTIAAIGQVSERGTREIDAADRYVSPGFIDMMDQSGSVLRRNGSAQNKLAMGVTTLIAGEDGPPVPARQIKRYFNELERSGIAVNFGTYYSATQARVAVMGDVEGEPTTDQLERMRAEVREAMHGGAFGISTALIYPPSSFHGTAELIELAKVSASCGGFYSTHMRDESGGLLRGIGEAIEIGERSGAKVEIFHLKAAFAPQWGKLMPQAVELIESARARGVDVAADMYPYTAGGTGLSITAPNWIFADGEQKGYERLRDPEIRVRLKREVAEGSVPGWSNMIEATGGWDHIVLANGFNPRYERFHGKSIAAIAQALGNDPADTAWDIVLEALPKRAMALFFMMDERDIETGLRQSWVSIGSDAASAEQMGATDDLGLPHPRAYGTFPRILAEYVKQRRVLTLEQAVRKMTSWPATRMGLYDRGVLRVGARADITVFSMDRIADRASWEEPTETPLGIDYVIVNGTLALDEGRFTGSQSGTVLRHECRSVTP